MVNYTPKEQEFLNRFLKLTDVINKNPNQSIGTLVESLATQRPKDIGLLFKDDSWTWQEINTQSNKVANYFYDMGLNLGECSALMAVNSPEYLFIAFGVNKIQGINGLINYHQKKQALVHSMKVVTPKFIIVDGENLPAFYEVVEDLPYQNDQIYVINNEAGIPHDFMDLAEELKSASGKNPETSKNADLQHVAYYIFSSGTTGLPKAIMMKQKKLFTQGTFLGTAIASLTPEDVVYIITPLYHNIAVGQSLMASLLSGAKIALREKFSASEFWRDVQKYQATYTAYVGEIPRYLLNQPPSEYEKSASLKYMVGVGLRKEVWERFRVRFNVEHIFEYYGSTESHRAFINIDEKPGMVGRYTMPGLVLAKVNPETGRFYKDEKEFCIKCKPGDVGMALVKLDKIDFFARYKDEEKTKKKIMNDVFRKNDMYFNTDDMLVLHEDYWVSFYDRTGDTFRWKGENVSTLEVETILNSHPAIIMSAVFGVAIPNTEGKEGMAAIKLDPNIKFNLPSLSQFVYDVLPAYSIPIFVRFCETLELTGGTMKVKKFDLKNEGYDTTLIKDPLYFWDFRKKEYVPLTQELYQTITKGVLII